MRSKERNERREFGQRPFVKIYQLVVDKCIINLVFIEVKVVCDFYAICMV